ncbi:zinc finger protein 311-like isoform X2 [Aricia agestis]|uniref:zinc finger protein 311-like isoform X2 n=1 Tax=Aricia agestis TaxID=91739 RepID=UPI001C202F1F|nr:zinc finger protein 311-like isoform X2 [Aricia agestis]
MNIDSEKMLVVNSSANLSQESQSFAETCNVLDGLENLANVCRTCANVTEFVIPIFVGEGLHNNLAQKIQQHLPIKISEDDVLPHVVCYQCASTILAWHDLVECCLQADVTLQQRISSLTNETELKKNSNQRLEDNEESSAKKGEDKLLSLVYDILREYLQLMELDENNIMDLDYVCQVCTQKPAAKTIDNLVKHLQLFHSTELCNSESIHNFIRNNITFEESLSTEDRDDRESDTDKGINKEAGTDLPAYFCPYCDSAFSTPTRLIHHINRHIDISTENVLTCCGESFDKKSFALHLQLRHVARVVAGPYVCRSCSHSARTEHDLQAHVAAEHRAQPAARPEPRRRRSHAPATCPRCRKTFSNKHNMLVHLRSHNASEPFACDRCDRRYRTRSGLSEHRRIVHEGVMRHVCATCGEAFPTRGARDVHARLHSGARPFACDYCGKAYRAKNTLDRHIEAHLDVRKYPCLVCDKRFRRSSHLARHARVHDRDAQ